MTEKIPDHLKDKTNTVKNRVLFLSPRVTSGQDREARKEDFESLSDSNIGVGGFGRVYKVKHRKTGKIFAIKVVNKAKILENELGGQMKLEVEIMYKLDHPNIIKLYDHYEDEESFYLVMEYAAKGQLYTKLKLLGRLDERLAAQYIREVVSAIEYMHGLNPPIIHRDIKPENILLDENESAKLCDFGWSNFFTQERKRMSYCGTQEYLAPEMIKQSGHSETLDYWNIGVLAFELLAGRPPFEGTSQKDLFDAIVHVKFSFPKDFPKLACDLVCKLLKADPKERIRGKELVEHAWFRAHSSQKKSVAGVAVLHKLPIPPLPVRSEPKSQVVIEQKSEDKKSLASPGKLLTLEAKKDDKDAIIEKLTTKYKESTKELGELKAAYEEKSNLLERAKNESQEIGEHLGKLGKEFTPQAGQEIKHLNEELQRLKVLNKNREEMLAELNQKGALAAEYESRVKAVQEQREAARREREGREAKARELEEREAALEKQYQTLKQANDAMKNAKAIKAAELEGRLELLQLKLINKTEEGSEGESTTETMMEVVKAILEEIRDKTFVQGGGEAGALQKSLADMQKKVDELKSTHDKDLAEQKAQQEKRLGEVKSQVESETKEFAGKEELKVGAAQKELQEEEKNLGRVSIASPSDKSLAETREKQKTAIEGLKSQNEGRAHQISELRAQVKAINQKIEDTEYQYGLLKAEMLVSEDFQNGELDMTSSTYK